MVGDIPTYGPSGKDNLPLVTARYWKGPFLSSCRCFSKLPDMSTYEWFDVLGEALGDREKYNGLYVGGLGSRENRITAFKQAINSPRSWIFAIQNRP